MPRAYITSESNLFVSNKAQQLCADIIPFNCPCFTARCIHEIHYNQTSVYSIQASAGSPWGDVMTFTYEVRSIEVDSGWEYVKYLSTQGYLDDEACRLAFLSFSTVINVDYVDGNINNYNY